MTSTLYEFERREAEWFSEHSSKWREVVPNGDGPLECPTCGKRMARGKYVTHPRLDLVGTAEAAEMLGVERPRIGRWINKGGVLPRPVARVGATPLWHRSDIEALRDDVQARRRQPAAA